MLLRDHARRFMEDLRTSIDARQGRQSQRAPALFEPGARRGIFGPGHPGVEPGHPHLEAEAPQPRRDIHQAPPSSSMSAFASLRSGVSNPSVNQP